MFPHRCHSLDSALLSEREVGIFPVFSCHPSCCTAVSFKLLITYPTYIWPAAPNEDIVEEPADEEVEEDARGSAEDNVEGSIEGSSYDDVEHYVVDDANSVDDTDSDDVTVKGVIDNTVEGIVDESLREPVERVTDDGDTLMSDLNRFLHYTQIATYPSLAPGETSRKDTAGPLLKAFDELRTSTYGCDVECH